MITPTSTRVLAKNLKRTQPTVFPASPSRGGRSPPDRCRRAWTPHAYKRHHHQHGRVARPNSFDRAPSRTENTLKLRLGVAPVDPSPTLPRSCRAPLVGCGRNSAAIPAAQNPYDVHVRATVPNPKQAGAKIFFIGVGTRTYGDFGGWRNPLFSPDSCNTAGNRGTHINRR